jgi:diguanylate cyclase (GGDEF)-like protein/putative nucleotidyltransferase with HDIG domain
MNRTNHILHMSKVDSLTRLYNREYFKNYLDEVTIKQLTFPVSILMCDVNGLKILNDAYGSHWGDWYLKEVAKAIVMCSPMNAISARWGGDEFAILMSGMNKLSAEELSLKIKKQVDKINHQGLQLSVSFGSDTILERSGDFTKIIKNAEDAMFRDKILEDISVRSNMIATIIQTLNEKNLREEAHSRRVSELCEKMGEALKLSEKDIRDLKVIGLLHDIGKIAIDEQILNKPGKLTDEEYQEIKRHPEIGYRILSTSKEMSNYMDVILAHHERIDGAGYPNGLSGDSIPYLAKILSIIDSFDAMTCERPYKKQRTTMDAAMELIRCSGSQFDEDLVQVFVTKVLGLVNANQS